MTLKDMLAGANPSIADVAKHLDSLTHAERIKEAFALNRNQQRALSVLAADGPPATLEHFVPPSVPDATEVRHHGRNSLPLPPKHKLFQKRFCRPTDGTQRLYGYNRAPSEKLIGPGYFVAIPTAGNPAWEARGAIVVDYFQVPDVDVAKPEHWPAIRDNSQGLQRFVYKGTRDYMRLVSTHVAIGAAFKGEKSIDHYFILVREDA